MSGIRLNKYIASSGLCSRRDADELIAQGKVSINGKKVTELGYLVQPNDKVFVDKKLIRPVKHEYYRFYKPAGYITTSDDEKGRKTIYDLLPETMFHLKPVGRLDKDSTGLLILTNDGDLANKITHPSGGIIKRYRVLLNRDLDEKIIPALLRGVMCDGEKLRAEKIIPDPYLDVPLAKRRAEVWLSQGRKREIRRMFEVMGYYVKDLKRFQIGSYEMKRIPEGAVKTLSSADIKRLLQNGK